MKMKSTENGITTKTLQRHIGVGSISRMLVYIVPVLSISTALLLLSLLWRSEAPNGAEDSVSRLDAAVLRLMMADELAIDDEVGRSLDNLENILASYAVKESFVAKPAFQELLTTAGKIREFIIGNDRKSAIETLALFRQKTDEFDSAQFRGDGAGQDLPVTVFGISVLYACALISVLGSVFGFYFIARRNFLLRDEYLSTKAQLNRSLDDSQQLRLDFDEERARTMDLQQRLIEIGKNSRTREHEIEEMKKSIQILEKRLIDSTSVVNLNEEQNQKLEKSLAVKNMANMEINAQVKFLTARLEECELAMGEYSNKRDGEFNRLLEKFTNAELSVSTLKVENESLNALAKNIKSTMDSENLVLGWTNVKLANQNNELMEEVAKLKAELLSEARRFRDELAKRN